MNVSMRRGSNGPSPGRGPKFGDLNSTCAANISEVGVGPGNAQFCPHDVMEGNCSICTFKFMNICERYVYVHVAGRMCCEEHEELEDEYGKPKSGYRAAPREAGEDMGGLSRRAAQYFKERARHRFGHNYLQNILFFVFPCGIIRSFRLQFSHEGDIKTAQALKLEYPEGGETHLAPKHTLHPDLEHCLNTHFAMDTSCTLPGHCMNTACTPWLCEHSLNPI